MGSKKTIGKSKKLNVLLIIIAFLLILGIGGYAYINYNDEYLNSRNELINIENEIKASIPKEVTANLDFNFFSEESVYNVKVLSNNQNVINNTGIVVRPKHNEVDTEVTLTFVVEVRPADFLKSIYYSLLGNTHSFSVTVTVKKLELTNLDILEEIGKQLYIPKITKANLTLPTTIPHYDGLSIEWQSSNSQILTNAGEIVNVGSVTLEAKLTLGNDEKYISFSLEVVSELPNIIEVSEDFSGYANGSTYVDDKEFNGFIAKQSRFEDGKLRLRVNEHASITYTKKIVNPLKLHFKYQAITSSNFSSDVLINIMISENNGASYTLANQIKITDNNLHNYVLDLSSYGEIFLKIETTTTYSTMFIHIDDIVIERALGKEDIRKELLGILPKYFDSSYILPFATPYGGSITWTSSDEDTFSSDGLHKLQDGEQKITLTANITGVFKPFNLDFEISVIGKNYMIPVDVFFIDLGKYGEADTGESFYFKIGEIDILVDSGDNYNATKQAISEVIDANSNDKIIDYVIATHPDSDHIGSMKYVFDTYDVLNVVYFEGTHSTIIYQNFINAVKNENLVTECTILQSINNLGDCKKVVELAPGVKIEFIDTENYNASEPNDRSIVFVFEAYGTKILMTGDADGESLEVKYMNKVGKVNILKMVHHGSREGTSTKLLQAIDPEYVIISNGNYFGNKHGHPTFEAINRIYGYKSSIKIYAIVGGDSLECTYTTSYKCTNQDRFVDRNGTIKLTIEKNSFRFTSEYNEAIIELSSTKFWKTHPKKQFEYQP